MWGALLFAALAGVEPPPTVEPPAPPPASGGAQEATDDWYGAPAAVADGVSLVMLETSWGVKNEGLLVLGGAGYLLAGPLVHLAHLRGDRALGSLGLRILAAGAASGAVFADFYFNRGCDPDGGPPCGVPVTGLVIGGAVMLGAAILDDVWLANDHLPNDRVDAPQRPVATFTPSLVVTPQLGLLSFAGRF
jgi:hypothetical protein